jgi:hypothetical protein
MNVINDRPVMVFKKDNKYIIGISKKKKDNTYEKAYIKIEFGKDIELEDKTLIKIKNAWLDFYNWEYEGKKGTTWVIKCNEFEKQQNEGKDPFEEFGNNITTESDIGQQIQITDEDLPF